MQLQWTSSQLVSAVHTAWCVAHFPQSAGRLNAEWTTTAAALDELGQAFDSTRGQYWEQLLSLASTADGTSELAERVCGRLGSTTLTEKSRLAATLNQCRRLFESSFPKFQSDIPLRSGPIRQLWDAYGVGLLRMLVRQTDESVLVDQATVLLVQPVLGGFGYAHLSANRIHWEAMLTNVDPQLPEILRIAWLLAQLDLDRPVVSDGIHAHRLRAVAGLAMLPAILEAGQELELCRYCDESLASAYRLWHCGSLELEASQTLSVISSWWQTYHASRPAWPVALKGLDQLLLKSLPFASNPERW